MHYLSVQILLHSYFLHYTKFRSINEYEDTSQLQVTHKSLFLKSHHEFTRLPTYRRSWSNAAAPFSHRLTLWALDGRWVLEDSVAHLGLAWPGRFPAIYQVIGVGILSPPSNARGTPEIRIVNSTQGWPSGFHALFWGELSL